MRASELKYHYQQKQAGHFFDRKTLKFFGDTMKNYGVRDAGTHWELYRKRPVKHNLQDSHYFHKETFADISESGFNRLQEQTS